MAPLLSNESLLIQAVLSFSAVANVRVVWARAEDAGQDPKHREVLQHSETSCPYRHIEPPPLPPVPLSPFTAPDSPPSALFIRCCSC